MSDLPCVVRLITWLPLGGIERRLVSVLPRLREEGFQVRLVCLRELGPLAEELTAKEIPVDLIPLKSRLHPAGIRELALYLEIHQAQVVHSHMYRSNVPGTIAARMAHVPVNFAQVHNVGTWESFRQRMVDRFLCRWRTGVICVSEAVQEDVCKALGLPEAQAPVLYNGSDTSIFQPNPGSRADTRARLGILGERPVALVPARLHKQKNPLDVLQTFAEAREWLKNDPLLVFAGEGPLQGKLEEAVRGRRLENCVQILGRRDDMADLYNAADVVVLSSSKEGFSNAIVEALACGKPVIASDAGGNREALNTPGVGWVHEVGDMVELRHQLIEALSNPSRLAGMETACRERGEQFSVDHLVKETAALYHKALKAARGARA